MKRYAEVLPELAEVVSFRSYSESAAVAVERRGYVDGEFFDLLIGEFPRREAYIVQCAQIHIPGYKPSSVLSPRKVLSLPTTREDAEDLIRTLAQEFLSADWATFGVSILRRQSQQYGDSPEDIRILDDLTGLLLKSTDENAQNEAVGLISNWLERYPAHPRAPGFRLRLVLNLHEWAAEAPKGAQQGLHHRALRELDRVIEQVGESPELLCCRGGILTWFDDRPEDAVSDFLKAVALEPGWLEPHTSLAEALLLCQPPRSKEAVDTAVYALKLARNSRDKLLLEAIALVARVFAAPQSDFGQVQFIARIETLLGQQIPDDQRESFRTNQLCRAVGRNERLTEAQGAALRRLLEGVSDKLAAPSTLLKRRNSAEVAPL